MNHFDKCLSVTVYNSWLSLQDLTCCSSSESANPWTLNAHRIQTLAHPQLCYPYGYTNSLYLLIFPCLSSTLHLHTVVVIFNSSHLVMDLLFCALQIWGLVLIGYLLSIILADDNYTAVEQFVMRVVVIDAWTVNRCRKAGIVLQSKSHFSGMYQLCSHTYMVRFCPDAPINYYMCLYVNLFSALRSPPMLIFKIQMLWSILGHIGHVSRCSLLFMKFLNNYYYFPWELYTE